MQAQIIIVHDIQKAIEDVGIKPYANTLVQEMGGQYYYVEIQELGFFEFCPSYENIPLGYCLVADIADLKGNIKEGERYYLIYKIWTIPNNLAWFIIDCLKLKADAIRLGSNEYQEGAQAVYLTPGKEIFGHKIEKLTEIPAELMPVVVDRL